MLRIGNITFAAASPARLAAFWCAALGYELQEPPPGFMDQWIAAGRDPDGAAAAVDPQGQGPRLFFNKAPVRPATPGTCIPIHLDFNCDDPDAESERLVAIGAEIVEIRTRETGEFMERWIVMRDPEGNGFCVQ